MDQINNDIEIIQSNLTSVELYEISQIQEKMTELDFLMERQINLKYQVQGAKKKFALEVKKIENKFNILCQLSEIVKSSSHLKPEFEKINKMDG